MFLPLVFALATPQSFAAEIQVIADGPVSVEVDGRLLPNRPGERGATAADLAGGNHRVQVYDQDRLVASVTVNVTVTEQLRLELRRGQLQELGRGPLPSTSAECPPPPAPPAPAPGTFQLTGIAPDGVAVWVDGKPVNGSAGSFVARGLPAGEHEVRVAQGSRTLFAGTQRIYPDLVRRCLPVRGGLDCVMVESVVSIPPAAPPAPPPAPPPAGPTVIADRDFTSFVAAVKGEAFSSDQLGIVTSVAQSNWFTIAQVGLVLDQLAHSSDKVAAARILAPKVVDRQNAYKLNEHLTFSSDKEAVQALFR